MELISLSDLPYKPCILLKWPGFSVLLDTGIDLQPLTHFLPVPLVESARLSCLPNATSSECAANCAELKECYGKAFVDGKPEVLTPQLASIPIEQIDVVVICNSSSLIGLPFLVEKPGFRATIYATDPTIQLGRLMMEEIAEFNERISKKRAGEGWRNKEIFKNFDTNLSSDPCFWSPFYDDQAVKEALRNIKLIAFKETVDFHGVARISAYSSGHSLGSCNWAIRTDFSKICYITSSSVLSAHPKAVNVGQLKNADALILTGISQAPSISPETAITDFCHSVVSTVRNGGNALVPCSPTGTIYDLLECLVAHLDKAGISPDLPIYLVSPVADSTLAYANIYAEWLSDSKQQKVYEPKEPFDHAELIKSGRLKVYSSIYKEFSREFRTPCIVFAGHPALRFGDAVHFMEMCCQDQNSAVILTEPEFVPNEVLSAYQPMAMKNYFFPIDTRLDYVQVNKLLKELNPKRLYIPEQYSTNSEKPDYSIQHPALTPWRLREPIKLETQHSCRKVKLDSELARELDLSSNNISGDIAVCPVFGYLTAYNNKFILKPVSSEKENAVSPPKPILYGLLKCDQLLKLFKTKDSEAECDKESDVNFLIALPTLKTTVRVSDGKQTTVSHDNECDAASRKIVRDILCQCLHAL